MGARTIHTVHRLAKEEAEVVDGELAERFSILADGAFEHELLLLLELEDALLNGSRHDEARDTDRLVLPQPVNAVLHTTPACLKLQKRTGHDEARDTDRLVLPETVDAVLHTTSLVLICCGSFEVAGAAGRDEARDTAGLALPESMDAVLQNKAGLSNHHAQTLELTELAQPVAMPCLCCNTRARMHRRTDELAKEQRGEERWNHQHHTACHRQATQER